MLKQKYLIVFTFFMCLFFFEGRGQILYDWFDSAPDNNWRQGASGARWTGGLYDEPPTGGILRFNNNHELSMNNNVPGTYSLFGLVFGENNNSIRILNGNPIRFFDFGGTDPRIENFSSATHQFNIPINGDGTPNDPLLIRVFGSGGLTFNQTIDNEGANINIEGSTSSSTVVSFNNVINGSGGIFKTNTNIRLDFAATNTFTGELTIQGGEVRLTSATATLGNNNDIRIGEFGFLNLNDNDTTIRSVGEIGTGNGGTINLGSGTLTISGGFTTRFQNSISGTGGLVKNGTGTITLYGSQSYTGTTTINAGVVATGVDLASSEVIVNANGTFRVTNGQTVTINDLTLADGATLNLEAGSILNVTGEFNETNINITGTGELRVIRTTTQNGNWDAQSTWENDRIPSFEYDFITINHEVDLNNSRSVRFLNISSSGDLSVASTKTLSILNEGRLVNNGIFQANESSLEFLGAGSISGTVNLHNLEINGGVNVGSSATVANNCIIKANGSFQSNAPRFLASSTLIYDTGGNYTKGIEWNNDNTETQGTPHNVEIRTSDFQMNGESFSSGDATIAGDLIITGGSFNMAGFIHSDVEANNIIVNGGDIVIGDTSFGDPVQGRALVANGDFRNLVGNVTLGTGFQGDLKVRGGSFEYLTTNSTFDSKGRAIIFDGSQNITITSTGAIIIDFMVIDMPSGKVIIDNDLTIQGLSGTGGESGILLEMKNEATLDLNTHDLVLGGGTTQAFDVTMSNNTKIVSTPSTIIEILNNGTTELRLDESVPGVTNAVKKLVLTNTGSTTISNELHIFESLDVDVATVNGNNKLIFRSSESQTAIISEVKNGGSVTGTIRTERFFKMGNRAFRYVSPSVTSTATINQLWQEGQNNSNTTSNLNNSPGFGTHITGSLNGSNGFDATQSGNPSMFSWDNQTNDPTWMPIQNTDANILEVGKAYALMIRGDRSANLNDNVSTGASTILRSVGQPIVGPHTKNTSVDVSKFTLIGNPYQAQVDLTKVSKTNFGDYFYIWDPSIGNIGGYATVEVTGNTYQGTTPITGTDVNQFLQVNQAFFIQATTGGSQSITFEENDKSTIFNNLTSFNLPEYSSISVNLLRDNHLLVDGLRIDFDENYADQINFQDAKKLWNLQEYFAIDKNPDWLMVEKRSIPENESIQLFLDNYFSSEYSLSINVQNLNTHKAFLYDAYLDESIALENNQVNTYTFEVDSSIQATQGPLRFSLHFEVISLATNSLNDTPFDVFPNPTSESIYLQFPKAIQGEKASFQLVDMLGKVVFQQNNNFIEEKHHFELPNEIRKGIYIINVTTDKRKFSTKLIVK